MGRDQPDHQALFLQAICRDSGVAKIQKKTVVIIVMGFCLEFLTKSYFIPCICYFMHYKYFDYFVFLILF